MSLPRRAFCIGATFAAVSVTQRSWAQGAAARVVVLGFGGAGCNVLNVLTAGRMLPARVGTLSVNSSDAGRRADIVLPTLDDGSLDQNEVSRFAARVLAWEHVVLVAGIGRRTGTSLLRAFAKAAGATSSAVVILPFGFEEKKARECEFIGSLMRQLTVVDNAALQLNVPCETKWSDYVRSTNEHAAKCVARHVLERLQDLEGMCQPRQPREDPARQIGLRG